MAPGVCAVEGRTRTIGPYTLIKERQGTTITAESAELAEKYQEKTLCALCGLRG